MRISWSFFGRAKKSTLPRIDWRRLPLGIALVLLLLPACAHPIAPPASEARVYHVVLCWLKEPGNLEARQRIIDVSKTFKSIPGVTDVKAGPSIPSERAIVDDSFDVGILLTFPDKEAMNAYLAHPDHAHAVQTILKPLVTKIVVYDFND